jgi:hypothetical protein
MMGAEGETLSLEDKVLEAAASNSKVVDAQLLSDFGPSVNTTTASPITNKIDWEGLDTFGGGAQFDWDLFKLSNNITGFGSSPSW